MKKMKKLFAILMTMAMVMGLGITGFAATTPGEGVTATNGKITVENLTEEVTTVNIYKIVNYNETNGTWELVNENYKNYVNLLANPVVTIDWGGLKGYIDEYKIEATASETESDGTIEFDNLGIGAYLVVASGESTEYNVMGSFTYGYDQDHLMVPTNITIDAKGSAYTVTKTFANGDDSFVALGDPVTYNIDTVFPSYPEEETDRTFWIEDQPTGLKITGIQVYVGDMDTPIGVENYTLTNGEEGDTVQFPTTGYVRINFNSDYIGTTNEHAAQDVRVVVTAEVVSLDNNGNFKNNAITNYDSTPATSTGDTGSITIRKVDEDRNLLKGAIFNIAVKGEEKNLQFFKEAEGVYRLALETDSKKEENLEATNGTLVLKGLDEGVYSIVEKTAPQGYQVVDVNSLILEENRTIAAGEKKDITISVENTKLHSLPATGGMGTTLFTIAGCVIMISAAGLFFATRKKAN